VKAARSRSEPARRPLRLVFASAELSPLVRTGGLGEAVAGLATALAARGHEVTCLLPAWRGAAQGPDAPKFQEVARAHGGPAPDARPGRWLRGRLGAVGLELCELPGLFEVESPYGGRDEGRRFVAFSRAVAARSAELLPQVLVAHDWHAALSVCALHTLHGVGPPRAIGSVQVVHNNAHQGRFPPTLYGATGLPPELFRPDGLEFHGDLCLVKGGLAWADRVVAVSPRYAEELTTPEFGEGLEGLYRYRAHRLCGIANGIDAERLDPARDAALPAHFHRRDLAGRARCREALLRELALDPAPPRRLLVAVGRLAVQKGWDVLAEAVPALVERGFSLALLGEGDAEIAASLRAAARRFAGRVVLRTGWDEGLARRMLAGADLVLVPSRFEPCGLVQLQAQRYGALPIAHDVGGLHDTIRHEETGVLFAPLTVESLVAAAERGAALLARDGVALLRRLLSLDVSWRRPALRWERVLRAVADEGAARA
jgi:starch synthase